MPCRESRLRTNVPRAVTVFGVASRATRKDTEQARAERVELEDGLVIRRPRTRGDCLPGGHNAQRPCAFTSCRHHLALEVSSKGAIKLLFPHLSPDEIPETCSLDVADRGGCTLEEVGALMNVTRERVRQLEEMAQRRAGVRLRIRGHREGFVGDPEGSPLSEIRLMAGVSADGEEASG